MHSSMSDLVPRTQAYARQTREPFNHGCKYSNLPYQEDRSADTGAVTERADDQEMVAAAWLHDTLEASPATSGQIEQACGPAVTAKDFCDRYREL